MDFDKRKLEVQPADFDDAMDLQIAVAAALREKKLDISMDMADAAGDLDDTDLGSILQAVLSLVTSRELKSCLFRCSKKALYDNRKIDKDFFELPENRPFYYPIMIEVMKVNIGPFIGGLGGLFRQAKGLMKGDSRESK